MSFVIPVLVGLAAYALLGKKGAQHGKGGDSQFHKEDLDAVTVWRDVPGGVARYFKPPFIASAGIQLLYRKAEQFSQSGTTIVYRLISGSGAGHTAWFARRANQVVYVPIGLVLTPNFSPAYMMVSSQSDRHTFPYQGSGYAILYDIAHDNYIGEMPGGEQPQSIVQPSTPVEIPPGGFPPIPGGFPPIPGGFPPSGQPPSGQPPTGQPPTGQPPSPYPPSVDPLECPSMTEMDRVMFMQLLADENANPEALELAAKAFDAKNCPRPAMLCRKRAEYLRGKGKAPPVVPVLPIPPPPKVDIPPIPPGGQPPVPPTPGAGPKPHVIREGDIPYFLAKYYTGNGNRFKELVPANPGMKIVTKNGITQLEPWKVGQTIMLPESWNPWAKPTPGTLTTPATPPVADNLPPGVKKELPVPGDEPQGYLV